MPVFNLWQRINSVVNVIGKRVCCKGLFTNFCSTTSNNICNNSDRKNSCDKIREDTFSYILLRYYVSASCGIFRLAKSPKYVFYNFTDTNVYNGTLKVR